MRVLLACEHTEVLQEAFEALGHYVVVGNEYVSREWDLIVVDKGHRVLTLESFSSSYFNEGSKEWATSLASKWS